MSRLKYLLGAILSPAFLFLATNPVAAQRYDYNYDPYTYGTADAAFGGSFFLLTCCIVICSFALQIGLTVYVYNDAKKHNVDNAWVWALVTFLSTFIGLLIYFLAIRPDAVKKMEASKSEEKKSSGPIEKN